MMKRRWTLERAVRLRSLAIKVGIGEAGRRRGISGERVRQVISEHGLPPMSVEGSFFTRNVSSERVIATADAPSLQEAALRLGVSQIVARRLFEREGIKVPRHVPQPRVADAEARDIHARYLAGDFGLAMAAHKLGYSGNGRISASHAKARFERMGLKVLSVKEGNRARDRRRRGGTK